MPISKVWIYRLLFVCNNVCLFVCLFVCTVTDFTADDKAIGVKFRVAVHWRQRERITHFGELSSPRSSKSATNRLEGAQPRLQAYVD